MTTKPSGDDAKREALRHKLLQLAREEDELAHAEGARAPYWAACPPSVQGHRAAADALRDVANRITNSAPAGPQARASVLFRTSDPVRSG